MNQTQNTPASDEIDLMKLVGKLLDNYKLVLGITAAFSVLSLGYIELATPIYKADALIQIESKKSGTSALLGDMGDMFAESSSANKEIEIIKSRMVLGKTIEDMHLNIITKPKITPIIGKIWAKFSKAEKPQIVVNKFDVPEALEGKSFQVVLLDDKLGTYSLLDANNDKVLEGHIGKLSQYKNISVMISDIQAKQGQKFTLIKQPMISVINGLQKELTVKERTNQSGILELSLNGDNRQHIEEVLNSISQNFFLQNVERNTEEAQKSLTFLEQHLPGIKQDLTIAENRLNDYRKTSESVDLSLEAKATLDAMVKIEEQLNAIKFKESEISRKFTKEHPAYSTLIENRATLLEQKQKLSDAVKDYPETQQRVFRLQRDATLNQQLYVNLLNKQQELSIAKAGTIGNVRIIDNAMSGIQPLAPKKALIFALATLLGLISGVMVTLIRSSLMAGIEEPSEVDAIGIPVYATVPLSEEQLSINDSHKQKKDRVLLSVAHPTALAIEALRSLRTNLHFSLLESNNNIVTISGPSANVGKSFISVNLASVLAQSHKKVLLIDADLRKGTLERYMQCDPKHGLSDYLANTDSKESIIKTTPVEKLHFINRGSTPPNPSELLMQPKLKELLDWAQGQYDWVIVDTPPILAVTDAALLATFSGPTLLVGKFGFTRLKELEMAKQRFEQSNIKINGFILNQMQKKMSNYYYSHYYYQKYGDDKKELSPQN